MKSPPEEPSAVRPQNIAALTTGDPTEALVPFPREK
jgi:hypothetical protein